MHVNVDIIASQKYNLSTKKIIKHSIEAMFPSTSAHSLASALLYQEYMKGLGCGLPVGSKLCKSENYDKEIEKPMF